MSSAARRGRVFPQGFAFRFRSCASPRVCQLKYRYREQFMFEKESTNPALRLAIRAALTGSSLVASLGVANAQQMAANTAAPAAETIVTPAQCPRNLYAMEHRQPASRMASKGDSASAPNFFGSGCRECPASNDITLTELKEGRSGHEWDRRRTIEYT